MALQRGPGEGYHAAKAEALQHDPRLICRVVNRGERRVGYIVEDRTGRTIGTGVLARDAWAMARKYNKESKP